MEWRQLLCTERSRMGRINAGTRDLRSEFEKDYHRIIGSASFRRLQDKTQVFPLDKSDFIRTRLTHSFEVSSFAKSLGQNISEYLLVNHRDPNFTMETRANICDILQCAGLIHDIGNPPFGHFGETAIREWFRNHLSQLEFRGRKIDTILSTQMLNDFYQFEGNAQALRLVTKLHYLVDENGMNLTYGLLSTIIKYPTSSIAMNRYSENIKDKKMGYFYADKDIYERIQQATGTQGCRNPLTFILEAADDIAYKTADIEDAVKKGCISYYTLVRELEELCKSRSPESNQYFHPFEVLQNQYQKGIEEGVHNPEMYAVQNWIVRVQGYLIKCATYGFTSNYGTIMSGEYKTDLFHYTYARDLMDALGDIAYRHAFITPDIYKLEIAAGKILEDLFNKFVPAAIQYDSGVVLGTIDEKLIALISDNYINCYHIHSQESSEAEQLYLRILLVTDLVCGMTDGYARSLYQELNGFDWK